MNKQKEYIRVQQELFTLLNTIRTQSHYVNTYLSTKEYRLASQCARLVELYSQRVYLLVEKLERDYNNESGKNNG